MYEEGVVGGSGPSGTFRLGQTGELIQGRAHGEHYEAVSRGNVFSACSSVSGSSLGGGAALTEYGAFILFNPPGSGVNLSLLTVSFGYLNGPTGGHGMFLTGHSGTPIAAWSGTGSKRSPRSNLLGSSALSKAQAFTECSGMGTSGGAFLLRPVAYVALLDETAVIAPFCMKAQINGEICIAPGYVVRLVGIDGGSSAAAKFILGMSWEEIPRVQ